MKRCMACGGTRQTEVFACPACGFKPEFSDGYESHAPALAHEGGGFKPGYFAELAQLEAANFWFKARNTLVLHAIQKYTPNFRSMLEIGCGTGYVLNGVSEKFPQAHLFGSEIFISGLDFASARVPRAQFMQMDARRIPYAEEFDVIGAFDVLEHINEDEVVLHQVNQALVNNGFLVLTVPQHPWLWSPVDEYACHERRYDAASLHRKIRSAGFQIIRSTSFVTSLLPAMALSRYLQKKSPLGVFDAASELKISPFLNAALYQLLRLEFRAIQLGLDLPVGGSRLVVAKKIGRIEGVQK